MWLRGKILLLWESVRPKKSHRSPQVDSLRSSCHRKVDEGVILLLICYWFYLTTLISNICFLLSMHFLAILIISTCKQGTDQKASARKSYNINLLSIFPFSFFFFFVFFGCFLFVWFSFLFVCFSPWIIWWLLFKNVTIFYKILSRALSLGSSK